MNLLGTSRGVVALVRFCGALTLLGLFGCATTHTKICDSHVSFTDPTTISFTGNEKLLLCGDESKESWKSIPPAQVEFTLRNFLKQRGYYHPVFKYQNDVLSVDPGALRTASELTYEGQPQGFDDIKIRDVLGQALTSALLDKIEDFTLSRVKNFGYACPKVKLQASEETGAIHVFIQTGPPYYFREPVLKDTIGLYPKTMRRFDAFGDGDPFRAEWVKLSSNRAENDGIVVSSQFNFVCPKTELPAEPEQHLAMDQRIIGGDKHLLTIGAGISTEEFPIAELSVKSVRLNERGANLQATLHVSQRIQQINAVYTDFLFKNAPRFDFAPNVTIDHDVEPTYSFTQFQAATPLEYRADTQNTAWLFSVGPALNRQFSYDYSNLSPESYLSLIGHVNFMTHGYELYATDPREGATEDLNIQIISDQISVTPLAEVLRFTGSNLFKMNPVDPPQWIFGVRYGASATNSQERPQTSTKLPPQYFNTLGGDQNLRGFGRNELAQGTVGAMTSVFVSTEFRYAKTISLGIEPFVFFDAGALGATPFDLESVFYYSPGFGIRWSTPFGSIRGTLAHGYLTKNDPTQANESHLQAFFSFVREF